MKGKLWLFICLLLLSYVISNLAGVLILQGRIQNIKQNDNETAAFRKMALSESVLLSLEKASEEGDVTVGELLAVWMSEYNFDLSKAGDLSLGNYLLWEGYYEKFRKEEYQQLLKSYQAIWDDLKYFPTSSGTRYENSWMYERTYGGKRGHEGTDLMPPKNKAGYYPIYSMTGGEIEKIGWLDQGGWRIGIRSAGGAYFYYAHLDSYANDFAVGDSIKAGTLLGYMGDSGYGPEGTTGEFDVHLHLGIYIQTENHEEISINPYWILRSVEEQKLKYQGDLCYNQS